MSTQSKPIQDVLHELQGLDVPALVHRYAALHGRPPRVKNRSWLLRRCAWKEQELRFGGLSTVARRRIGELQAQLDLPGLLGEASVTANNGKPGDVPVGTRLEREWRGQVVVATRRDSGWEVDGVVHRSLSAAAKAITGSHISGPAFFGLQRGRPRRR